jgi:CheY-like chemotaxis protein
LRFEVADSGLGLNLEQQRNCFQVPATMADLEERPEKGVGLVLCKSLVEAMGGTIGVESKPGRGATFWFEIPFLRATTGAPIPKLLPHKQAKKCRKSDRSVGSKNSLPLDPVPDDGGLQILLVDESNAGRNVMIALLEQSGHSVTTADNGDAMVSAVSQGSYDVVLMETQLNKDSSTTALDAVQEIRKNGHSVERLPILALTASVPRADYPELGLNDWLTKPILMKDIKAAMTNAICNVGASSVCTGSICTGESSLCAGEQSTIGTKPLSAIPQVTSSLESVHSAFSNQLQAVMGSSTHHSKRSNELVSSLLGNQTTSDHLPFMNSQPSKQCRVAKATTDRPPRMLRRRTASPDRMTQASEFIDIGDVL